MSWDAGAIKGALDWDISSFARGQLQAEGLARLFPSIVTDFLANPLLGWASLATVAAAGVTAAIGGVASFVKNAFKDLVNEADNLNDMAKNVGVPVNTLHAMGLAAENAGGDVEKVAETFKFLGKNAVEAAQGFEKAMASGKAPEGIAADFQRVGVAVTDTTGKVRPLAEILLDVSDRLARMPEEMRSHTAMSLLGRGGSEMISFLSEGSDEIRKSMNLYERWGLVVSQQTANASDNFNDVAHNITLAWEAVKRAIGRPILNAIVPHLGDIQAWLEANMPDIVAKVEKWTKQIVDWVGDAVAKIRDYWKDLKKDLDDARGYLDAFGEVLKTITLAPVLSTLTVMNSGAVAGQAVTSAGSALLGRAAGVNIGAVNVTTPASGTQINEAVRKGIQLGLSEQRQFMNREMRLAAALRGL